MENAKARRNLIAMLIGLPVIMLAATLFNSGGGGHILVNMWSWLAHSKLPLLHTRHTGNATQTQLVDLTGEWYFATGDDDTWAEENFDHSSWDTLDVPSYWEQKGYRDYNGFAWYRREFTLDSKALNKQLLVTLGRIDDTDEVFVNGDRIGGLGQFPPTYVSAWNKHRNYAIPDGLAREGENIIAVRVYDAQMGGGITDAKIGIYASNLPRLLVDLHGEWQFRTGDEADWKNENIDEGGFARIQVPAKWEEQGYAHHDGYAWYRTTFAELDVPADETLVLLLGKIDDTDEVFLNGERIGKTGRLSNSDRADNPEYYALDRRYEFSPSLLKESNTLAVRVHDSTGEGGIYAGPVGIMKKSAYVEYQQQRRESGR